MPADSTEVEKKKSQKQEGSVKETIESILIAFILAFVFRAFVVEAFVIPTGSMGPTLMGAHMRVTCDDCGYSFPVNFSTGSHDDTDIPPYIDVGPGTTVVCPNCGYNQPIGRNGQEPIYFGDRILVLKYRYLFSQPSRWDVVVFKSPYEAHRDPEDPKYADNYIKRLIGKPNESVLILDGDIYIGQAAQKPEQFEIQRKPRFVQDAMWRLIFDNDYLPHGLDRLNPWQEPWQVESGTGWHGPSGGGAPSRVFQFNNPTGASTINFDSTANHPAIDMFKDWLAYDEPPNRVGQGETFVSDLKFDCAYRRQSGQGPLRIQLTKRDDCFTAEFLPGKVVLHRDRVEQADPLRLGASQWAQPLEADVPELNVVGRPIEIEVCNVDYCVNVRINGRDVLTTDDSLYHPNVPVLLKEAADLREMRGRTEHDKPSVHIIAANQICSLEHLKLSRDVYYLNWGQHYQAEKASDGTDRYSPDGFFGSPENIQHLGPDEYFVMGDNSAVSLDARFWGAPVNLPHEGNYYAGPGRVPGRFMLGKAFFVYWPAGYRPAFPKAISRFGVEPDFGDMRFIH